MTDSMHQPRDENGQFVSLGTLFERFRTEHEHEHQAQVLRTEQAIEKALGAVAETARIHAVAHMEQHISHERIHAVEDQQVSKAEQTLDKRLEGMNGFRQALVEQAANMVTRELFDTQVEKFNVLEKRIAYYSGAAAVVGASVALIIRLLTT